MKNNALFMGKYIKLTKVFQGKPIYGLFTFICLLIAAWAMFSYAAAVTTSGEKAANLDLCWIDWLFTVLRPAQEFFTYMETSPLPVKGCKI
jgi:hypothetical protein